MSEIKIHPLQRARKQLGLKQQVLADLTGLSLPTIKRAERGLVLNDYSISQICTYFSMRYNRKVEPQELGLYGQWEKDESMLIEKEVNVINRKPASSSLRDERDGCFSFGKIKTTWKILDGDGSGMYLPQHIRSHYIPLAEELPDELQASRNNIEQEQKQKRAQGLPFLWNGETYSLDRFVIGREPINEGMTLDLWFRPSDYYTFLATNMSLKDPYLREKYLADVDWDEPVPYFSHSFGVSLAVVTSDGYTLFTKRGKNVGTLPSTYETSVAEGLSRPIDRGTNGEAPDVYRCACRGLAEELGLRESVDFSVSDIAFLSFGVSTQYALWALRGMVKIKKGINDLMAIWDNGVRDKFENQQIIPIPFTPEDVVSFVFTHQSLSLRPTIYHALVHEFGRDVVNRVISFY
ncbi:MAG: helix-turn-helix transcriptional regulator [Chloroflexi bacterium]|nr:MAG: helix-turn-helix transcriptional regulator [Chloroflexota bacterium]